MITHLNLGCGNTHNADPAWLHHDLAKHHENVRLVADLSEVDYNQRIIRAWNGTFELRYEGSGIDSGERMNNLEEIHARDVLEHLPPHRIHNIIEFCWNHLRVGGKLFIQVPQHGSENALIDPTHYRGFHLRSFDMFDPLTAIGRKSTFYGLGPWKLSKAEIVPRSNVNLSFVLERLCRA